MARTALGRLDEADQLDKTANRIAKRDPESSRELHELARRKRKVAIKAMKPRRKSRANLVRRS